MTWVLFFRGLPGVGKSTIARLVSSQLNYCIIDYDDVKGELVKLLKIPTLAKASYGICFNILKSNISCGIHSVFDSHGFYSEAFNSCIEIAGIDNVILVNCICSDDLLWQMHLDERKPYAKASQIHDLKLIKSLETKIEPVFAKHIINLDTLDSKEHNVSKIVSYIEDLEKNKSK